MKLAIESAEVRKYFSDSESFQMLKRAGFDAIDFSFYEGEEWFLKDDYQKRAYEIRENLHKSGLECAQAHAPFGFKYEMDFDESCERYLAVVRSMHAASILGAPYIVVHSVYVPDGVDVEEYNVGFYKSLEKYCKEYSIKVAVENLAQWDEKTQGLVDRFKEHSLINDFVRSLDSEYFVVCIDTGHAAISGMEPQKLINKIDSDLLCSLHIHDTNCKEDNHYLPFIGKHNWEEIIEALKKKNYEGVFTFEVGGFFEHLPKELYEDALLFTAKVGRYLISLFEKK